MTCPPTAHDYVVVSMQSVEKHRCYYTVKCTRCEDFKRGYYDEIPPARFDTQAARELAQ